MSSREALFLMRKRVFGMPNPEGLGWFKSGYGNANSECIEVDCSAGPIIPVCDGKNPHGSVL